MWSQEDILQRAREVVDRLEPAQVRRLARLEPGHIPLALEPETAATLGTSGAVALREAIAVLCAERARPARRKSRFLRRRSRPAAG